MNTEIKFGRFTMRAFSPWEGQALFRLTGDPIVTQYMGFRTHETVEEATLLIERYRSGPGKYFAICTDEVLGVVGLEVLRHQATMLIMVRPDLKARGVGREFGAPFSQWIMSHKEIWRLWSYVHVDNIMGQRVTERSGAKREGLLKRFEYFPNVSTEPQDCYIYAITR